KHNGLFKDLLDDFEDRVKIFGTHFATLDIRQDSRVHQSVIDEIIKKKSVLDTENISTDEKLQWLLEADTLLDPEDFEDVTRDTLRNIQNIRAIQKKNGQRGLSRYIISNSDQIKDVLNVFGLFRLCGYSEDEINIDIVPLFETMEGLDAGEDVMRQLYALPVYRKHLERRGNQQTIMLGFSDGTKDGGYLKANWEIYETKEQLTKAADEKGI